MNNANFVKTVENTIKHRMMNDKSHSNYYTKKCISEELLVVDMKKQQ